MEHNRDMRLHGAKSYAINLRLTSQQKDQLIESVVMPQKAREICDYAGLSFNGLFAVRNVNTFRRGIRKSDGNKDMVHSNHAVSDRATLAREFTFLRCTSQQKQRQIK